MDLAICAVPAAPVRKKPSHKVEMVNQLLFGERMVVLQQKRSWLRVQSTHDNYEGWIRNNLIGYSGDGPGPNADEFVTGDLFNLIMLDGIKMHVSAGCCLPGFTRDKGIIGKVHYTYRGKAIKRSDSKPQGEVASRFAMEWMNAPYLWGGRTPLGVDCSGFVQVIFKMMGLDLLRDAKQQARQGMKVKTLTDAKTGDLAFFEKKGKITHVGMLLSPDQIIHASGKVRIDKVDNKGIINGDTGKRTHSLVSLRRYW